MVNAKMAAQRRLGIKKAKKIHALRHLQGEPAGDCGLGDAHRSAKLNEIATDMHRSAYVRSADCNVADQIRLVLLACCKPYLCNKEPMTAAAYTERTKCCQGCAAALTFRELV